jgi:FtsP/CotA-like multicopper oxidase with cupredoxin domain
MADQEIVEILTEHYFYRGIVLPVEAISSYVARRSKMYFAIYPKGTAGMGEGGTAGNNTQGYEDNSRTINYLGTNTEFIMINKSSVIHLFHIHINEYQVCGYRDGAYGNNAFTDSVADPSAYVYANEIDVPFEGFEDVTTLPVGDGNQMNVVPNEVDPGYRGEIRLRTTFLDFTGLFVAHCHLLDDQDMGMMMQMEVVGPDYHQGKLPANNPNPNFAAPFGDQFQNHFDNASL